MDKEKPIPGFSNYIISNKGVIINTNNGHVLTPIEDSDDHYYYVMLFRDGEGHKKQIHRLMGTLFLDNPDNLPIVNHKNGDKSDNRLSNLEWVTTSENTKHAFDHGLANPPDGEKNGKSKLSRNEVKRIRKSDKTGKDLAKKYGVSQGMISLIRNNENWTHL